MSKIFDQFHLRCSE